MNEEYNLHPYHNHPDNSTSITVTPVMIEHLKATKPWVRFVSIVMFIMVGLSFLGGLGILLSSATPALRGVGFGPVLAIIYWVMGALYLAPAVFLYRFASYINDLLKGGGDVALEMALGSQKSFWRFTGIVTLVVICLYAVFILIAIFAGLSAMRGF